MVQWQPGTQYNYNDVVSYQGADYKIIQPHRSQGDWTPDVTPALWGKMQTSSGGGQWGYQNNDCHNNNQPQQQPYQPPPQQQQQQPPPPAYNQGQSQQAPPEKQEEKPSGPNVGKILGIAGGIAAGAGILGVGVAAYKKHENAKDEEAWIKEAELRAQNFYAHGGKGAANWLLTRGKEIPQNAIPVDPSTNSGIFLARSFHKGSVTPGGASQSCKKGAVIGYAHEEIHKSVYEVLVGDYRSLKWVAASGKLNVNSLGARPVEGGVDSDGTTLYVARGFHKGGWFPGKSSEKLKAAFIPYDDDEVEAKTYEILCYA